MIINVQDILDILSEIDSQDPIDWAMLAIDERAASELIINNLIDQYYSTWSNYAEPARTQVIIATIAKLVLENFVLNLKLHQRET